jgi:hypothetical protein
LLKNLKNPAKLKTHRFNFVSKKEKMEGLAIIEGKVLETLKQRLENIEQTQLAIIKMLQNLMPQTQSNVPDFISITDACKKYHVSHVTINNKIRLFKEIKGREIDRLQSGYYNLINESELQEALRIKGAVPKSFLRIAV